MHGALPSANAAHRTALAHAHGQAQCLQGVMRSACCAVQASRAGILCSRAIRLSGKVDLEKPYTSNGKAARIWDLRVEFPGQSVTALLQGAAALHRALPSTQAAHRTALATALYLEGIMG